MTQGNIIGEEILLVLEEVKQFHDSLLEMSKIPTGNIRTLSHPEISHLLKQNDYYVGYHLLLLPLTLLIVILLLSFMIFLLQRQTDMPVNLSETIQTQQSVVHGKM